MSAETEVVLPDWSPGTVVVLATLGRGPQLIPVSAALRAGPRAILLGLAESRGSLARLRADCRVAVFVIAADLAFTAYGRAYVLADAVADGVVAVAVDVDRVEDHMRPTFAIDAAVSWHWTDQAAQAKDAEVRAALARLALTPRVRRPARRSARRS